MLSNPLGYLLDLHLFQVGGLRKDPEASGTTYSRLFNGVKIFKKSNAKFLVLSGKREAEDTILPIPVGYTYSLSEYNITSIIPSAEGLSTSSYAIHEWIGMIWYKVSRKSMQVT